MGRGGNFGRSTPSTYRDPDWESHAPGFTCTGLPGVVVQGVDRSDLGIGFFFDSLTTPVLKARTSLGRFAQGQAAGKQFFQGRVSFTFITGGHRRGLHSSPCVTASRQALCYNHAMQYNELINIYIYIYIYVGLGRSVRVHS